MGSRGLAAVVKRSNLWCVNWCLFKVFFGGSFLVTWALVGANFVASERFWLLTAWVGVCFAGLQAFKMYTFARGYAQGLSFLQRLKTWNLIDWGQRLKLLNAVLVALFLLQIAPGGGAETVVWTLGAGLFALGSAFRTRDRALIVAVAVLLGVLAPWEKILATISM